jgi:glycerophosphoryl diester phosphodiesterase
VQNPRPAPALYAHRGASGELPENTIPAFWRALEVGATALETDVHLTRDGHVVVSHDPTGDRTAGVPRAIRDATLAEVRAWDVGRVFRAAHPDAPSGRFVVPTLDEVLAEVAHVPLNVDIKRHDAWAARAVVDVVRRRRAQDRVRLASFDAGTLRVVRRLGYEGPTSLGASEVLLLFALPTAVLRRVPLAGDAAQIPTRQGWLRLDTPGFIAKAHALGLLLHYWTIDDPREAERLLAAGADGIMTNEPARLAPLFARSR